MTTYNTVTKAARNGLFIGAMAIACAAVPTGAHAALPAAQERAATGSANPGRIQEQLESGNILPQVSPRIEVKNLILQQVPEGAENINLTLNSLELEGVTAYTSKQLQPVYADRLGGNISLADVYAIATALTNKYRNDGYILTQVIVPPQTIQGGVVKLQVIEGYIDNVVVTGEDDPHAMQLIRSYASNVQTGKTLNVKDLERWLLLINDLPGVEARSVLSPSKTQTGAADMRVIVERDPYDALLAVDDYGSRYLGPLQFTAAGASNSFWGNNERISGQFVLAPNDTPQPELAYISAVYDQPIGTRGTRVQVSFSNTNTEPGHDLEQFDVRGHSVFYSLNLLHPVIRSRSQNLYAHLLFDYRDVSSHNNLEATREDHIRALRAGGRYEFLDTLVGVGVNSIDLEVAQGLNMMGASDEGDLNMTRPTANPEFLKLTGEAQRLQRLTSNLNMLIEARGQWSADELLSSEEFGVGGINSGRGYAPSEIVGDDGVSGKLELQWNKPYPWDLVKDYQLFSFYDAGVVWNKNATAASQKRDSLASAGFGIRTKFEGNTKADLAIGFPLTTSPGVEGDQAHWYLGLSKGF